MRRLAITALVLAGCAADAPPPGIGVCTKALYDQCATEHDCMSNDCRTFMGDGFQACTQGCSAANPCPDQDGAAVECNNMGICKPPAATECKLP